MASVVQSLSEISATLAAIQATLADHSARLQRVEDAVASLESVVEQQHRDATRLSLNIQSAIGRPIE